MSDFVSARSAADPALCEHLAVLLRNAQVRAGPDFSGLGVLVTNSIDALPLFPIGPQMRLPSDRRVADVLGSISRADHPCHDGFHILNGSLRLLATSQYFSPAIQDEAQIDRSIKFGGRYLAALFGSCLPDVLATGIATREMGVAIFTNGTRVPC